MSKQNMPPVIKQKKKILGLFTTRQAIVFAVVFSLIGGSAILYKTLFTKGANYSFFQESWDSGASTTALANHNDDQEDWEYYYSKDDGVSTSTSGQLTLSAQTASMTDTETADFNAGIASNTYIDNGTVKLKKPNGVACTSDNECSSDKCDTNCRNLQAGDSYEGGIIFYLSGSTGWVAQASDVLDASWNCPDTNISGADSMTDGMQNTMDIVNNCSTSNSPADQCYESTVNDYTDWYLPSIDQLEILEIYKVEVGGLSDVIYWSSTESDSTHAWGTWFNQSSGNCAFNKGQTHGVRCIRSF